MFFDREILVFGMSFELIVIAQNSDVDRFNIIGWDTSCDCFSFSWRHEVLILHSFRPCFNQLMTIEPGRLSANCWEDVGVKWNLISEFGIENDFFNIVFFWNCELKIDIWIDCVTLFFCWNDECGIMDISFCGIGLNHHGMIWNWCNGFQGFHME